MNKVCNWGKSSLEQCARGLNIVCNNAQVCAMGGKGLKKGVQGCARGGKSGLDQCARCKGSLEQSAREEKVV